MLELSYYLLFISLVVILMFFSYTGMTKAGFGKKLIKRNSLIIGLIILLWVGLQTIASKSGFYNNQGLPPRVPLFMILPLVIGMIVYMRGFERNKAALALPIYLPILFQGFRAIIEVLFHFTYKQGILPEQVTFTGVNYDILIGLSAYFVGAYAYKSEASKRILLIWNVIGLALILFAAFTFITSFYFPQLWDDKSISLEFIQLPFMLLPAFFLPIAVFMHIFSIRQLLIR